MHRKNENGESTDDTVSGPFEEISRLTAQILQVSFELQSASHALPAFATNQIILDRSKPEQTPAGFSFFSERFYQNVGIDPLNWDKARCAYTFVVSSRERGLGLLHAARNRFATNLLGPGMTAGNAMERAAEKVRLLIASRDVKILVDPGLCTIPAILMDVPNHQRTGFILFGFGATSIEVDVPLAVYPIPEDYVGVLFELVQESLEKKGNVLTLEDLDF